MMGRLATNLSNLVPPGFSPGGSRSGSATRGRGDRKFQEGGRSGTIASFFQRVNIHDNGVSGNAEIADDFLNLREKEPMFTARLGKPKPEDCDSDDSIETTLSLLSCSSDEDKTVTRKKSKKRRRRGIYDFLSEMSLKDDEKKDEKSKTSWLSLAEQHRSRVGVLDQMLRQDSEFLGAYVKNYHGTGYIAEDLMDEGERALIKQAAKHRGISGVGKSYSTTNLQDTPLSPLNRPKHTRKIRKGGLYTQAKPNSAHSLATHINIAKPFCDRNTPRPRSSESTPKRFLDSPSLGYLRKVAAGIARPREIELDARHVFPDWVANQQLTNNVKKRINRTLQALHRFTGHGDDTDVTKGKNGAYTEKDHSRVPRYPQSIRVAPALAEVIRDDITLRMGRPKFQEINQHDLQTFDSLTGQKLGRNTRNLLIFNWLQNVNEDEFEDLADQVIEDFEYVKPTNEFDYKEIVQRYIDSDRSEPSVSNLDFSELSSSTETSLADTHPDSVTDIDDDDVNNSDVDDNELDDEFKSIAQSKDSTIT